MREQLLGMLEAEENKVIQQLSTAVETLDKRVDARFDALAEVVEQIADMVEELHEEEMEPEVEEEEKPDPIAVDTLACVKSIKALVSEAKPAPQQIVNLSPLQAELNVVKSQIAELKQNQLIFAKSLKQLLTAKRIPEFDSNGNVIAVRLEA